MLFRRRLKNGNRAAVAALREAQARKRAASRNRPPLQSDSKGPQQLQFGMRLSLWERTKETWDFLFGWNTPALRFGYMNRNRSSHFRWFYFYTPLVWAYLLGLRQS